ncbi:MULTISPECIES: Rrf2 family transcriptional regulator [unclassified Devosia]|uniref:Rrf2 family transcriptional regulator n=1 Tax=unclassified Devosia TaxID=196773 RepID=UPI000FD7DA06|nr:MULTISPECIES: Rrf2 family transcriptional regulator [unclassified Devosia]
MKRSSRLSVALHALVHLHAQPEDALTSGVLAVCLQTNPVVVRRVLGSLREAGLVGSSKGHGGGWQLARPAPEISVFDVYHALGETLLVRTESEPGDPGCAIVRTVDGVMNEVLADAEALLANRLRRLSIAQLAAGATALPALSHSSESHFHG